MARRPRASSRSVATRTFGVVQLCIVAAILAVSCAGLAAAASQPAIGDELLRLDCGGRLHVFPNGFLNATFDASRFVKGSGLAEVFVKKLKDRLKCVVEKEKQGGSAEITDEHWYTGWSLGPQAVVNIFRSVGRRTFDALPAALRSAMRKTYLRLPFFWNSWFDVRPPAQAWLPRTCLGDGPCYMTLDAREAIGATFKVAYDLCPATHLPFLSVMCEGSMCSRFLRPCSADADCQTNSADTGSRCLSVGQNPTTLEVFTALKDKLLYDDADSSELAKSVMKDLVNYYRSIFGLGPDTSDTPSYKVCAFTSTQLNLTSTDGNLMQAARPIWQAIWNTNVLYPYTYSYTSSPYGYTSTSQYRGLDLWPSLYQWLSKELAGCSTSGDTTTCSKISDWDGIIKLTDGTSKAADAPERKLGRDIAYSGPRVVLDSDKPVTKMLAFDCEGGLHAALMNFGLSARLPIVRPVVNWLGTYLKQLEAARYQARSVALPENSKIYYAPWTAAYLLSTFTNAPNQPAKPELSSFYGASAAPVFDVSKTDCTFDKLGSQGYCMGAVAKLLPNGLKVEGALAQCHGEPSGLPAFEIGISGSLLPKLRSSS
eukprot:tig00020723_g13497.t1